MRRTNLVLSFLLDRPVPKERWADLLSASDLVSGVVQSAEGWVKSALARDFAEVISRMERADRRRVLEAEGVLRSLVTWGGESRVLRAMLKEENLLDEKGRPAPAQTIVQSAVLRQVVQKEPLPAAPSSHAGPGGTRENRAEGVQPKNLPVERATGSAVEAVPSVADSFRNVATKQISGPVKSERLRPQPSCPPVSVRLRKPFSKMACHGSKSSAGERKARQDIRSGHRKEGPKELLSSRCRASGTLEAVKDILDLDSSQLLQALRVGGTLEDFWEAIRDASPHYQARALRLDGVLLEIVSQASEARQQKIARILEGLSSDQIALIFKAQGIKEALAILPIHTRTVLGFERTEDEASFQPSPVHDLQLRTPGTSLHVTV